MHKGTIQTLLYDEATGSLFAGDHTGRIKQYKRGNSHNNFSLVKDYGHVGIGAVFSSAQVGGLALFGGCDNYLVGISIREHDLVKKIRSPFNYTCSLQVCHGVDQKVYLSLGGDEPDYSSFKSDFLDVTEVYHMQKESSEFTKKQIKPKKEVEKVHKSD